MILKICLVQLSLWSGGEVPYSVYVGPIHYGVVVKSHVSLYTSTSSSVSAGCFSVVFCMSDTPSKPCDSF